MIDRLMIIYIAALDHRKVNNKFAPYLYELSEKYPMLKINTIPDSDLATTLWTGCYPHEHGMWEVRLKENRNFNTTEPQDYLPDILSTTFQCFIHLFTGKFNLASVPDWRRRRFDIFKARYINRNLKGYLKFSETNSIFNIIGEGKCNYIYNAELYKINHTLKKLFNEKNRLEVIESHGLDTITHWYIDDEEKMIDSYKKLDYFIKSVHTECREKGITLMVIGDHGQDVVKDTINIVEKVNEFGIQKNEITYFIEPSKVRFWFHSDSAREKILNYLSESDKGTLLHFEELHRYNIKFNDYSYGEYYFVLNPGTIFFPNDYYHPIGNIFLALTDDQQRSRIQSPIYRGYHGYLPYNECEKGFLMLLDNDYKTNGKEIEIIDVAPTVLRLMGYNQPESLKGVNAFHE